MNNIIETNTVYPRFHLYSLHDKFFIEPRDVDGNIASKNFLEIDRNFNTLQIKESSELSILIAHADVQQIFGIIGVIDLVSGPHLIVIKQIELVGTLCNAKIYRIIETDILPYKKTVLHLNEQQVWFNQQFIDMIQLILKSGGFYYSTEFDISHSLQWLSQNNTAFFQQSSMIQRANLQFLWNKHLANAFCSVSGVGRYIVPIIHGFVGVQKFFVRGTTVKIFLISRRSVHRAGVRFHMRGVDQDGYSANFIETEQIIELDELEKNSQKRISSFLQTRGSIPLYWSQRPNLMWQPIPNVKSHDQVEVYKAHMNLQSKIYGGEHVIINLVNQKGREKRVGGELERISLLANLNFVRYIGFDFHHECRALNWDRLNILKDLLSFDICQFGFFYNCVEKKSQNRHFQTGFFRTNCMDCLDRTNVVQAMIAKESLRHQLIQMNLVDLSVLDLELINGFSGAFKNLWADNGDECSKQYAGTGALKTDFTRFGKRTFIGAIQDNINSVTRYFKNNFSDGYKQDAIDLFLGNYKVDPNNLPMNFKSSIINLNINSGAIIGAVFSAAMTILCILIAENLTATLFWMIVFVAFMIFIFVNGEEFVSKPKLKQE